MEILFLIKKKKFQILNNMYVSEPKASTLANVSENVEVVLSKKQKN